MLIVLLLVVACIALLVAAFPTIAQSPKVSFGWLGVFLFVLTVLLTHGFVR